MDRIEADAIRALREFDSVPEPYYVSVSWGKDSVVVAHLAWRAFGERVRVAWFPAGAVENPDCVRVRDAFLGRFHVDYVEIEASGHKPEDIDGHDGAQDEFERIAAALAPRYVSGVRAAESGPRLWRMRGHGHNTRRTSAPIGWWSHADVFAYLARYDLPIHPAYAMTFGGSFPRDKIRVSTIGGWRGVSQGRREWEHRYYRDELRAIRGA